MNYSNWKKYKTIRLAENISQTTLDIELKAHKLLCEFLDIKSERDITPDKMNSYAIYVNEHPKWKQNTKVTRVNYLNTFFRYAVNYGWMLINPMENIKLLKAEEVFHTVLSQNQMKKLLEAPDLSTHLGFQIRVILELLYSCGFRFSELHSLTKSSFSNDYRQVRFIGKGSVEATLPVTRVATHFTKFYVENICKKEKLFPHHQDYYRIVINRTAEKVECPKPVTPHTIRRTIATHLSENGADIRYIQAFLRHGSINTTSRYIKQSIQKLIEIHQQTHPGNHA